MNGRMLVVDDEALIRQGLVHMVGSNPLGWEVVGEAADGEEAMQAVDRCSPDLIITDINMPVMNGLDLAERLHDRGQDVMIIILTGYREFEYAQRAIRYGAIEFLLKPFSLDEACRVLRKAYDRFRRKQADLHIMNQFNQQERIERWKTELTGLLLSRQLETLEARVGEWLDEASRMPLPDGKAEIHRLLQVMEDMLTQHFNFREPADGAARGTDPLLWMHSMPEVVAWSRRKSEEWLHLLERLLREQQDHVVTRVMNYVDVHYAGSCTLQTVAAHVHVTPNYLSHLFKKETGEGFSQYVSKLRIEKAKLLLQNTRQSMAAIAEQTGFDNSSYFTTVFKQLTGLSPRAYRKQHGREG